MRTAQLKVDNYTTLSGISETADKRAIIKSEKYEYL